MAWNPPDDMPTLSEWKKATSAKGLLWDSRSPDPALPPLDELVRRYERSADPRVPAAQVLETLYHVYLAANLWVKQCDHARNGTLHAGLRFAGDPAIRPAMAGLRDSAK